MTLLDEVSVLSTEEDLQQTAQIPEVTPPSLAEARAVLPARVLIAAALSCAGAALVTGGIFGSWFARLLGVLAATGGVGWCALVHRARRPTMVQAALAPLAIGAGALVLIVGGHNPADMVALAGDAVDAGRLLSPPVPFDPGWQVLLIVVFTMLGYGAAWLGANLDRPILAIGLPLPVIALTAITQPDSAKFLAGLFAFVPLVAAVGVLFSTGAGTGLSREFELARALRAALGGVLVVVALVGAQRVDFLFPEPAYDPTDQPQKPRAIPLSDATDRVLFSVAAPAGFTGPWRTGVLDIYDDGAWKLPGGTADRLEPIAASGALNDARAGSAEVHLDVLTGEFGPTPVVPIVPTAYRIGLPPDGLDAARWDPRTELVRLVKGRVPQGVRYTLDLPLYPTADELTKTVLPAPPRAVAEFTEAPTPPRAVTNILANAPKTGWARLDYVRHQLLDDITAAGPGSPVEVDAKRVEDLLTGSKKGTPFEIVAAQALLARWAGFPARIGFGFNGGNESGGRLEIRPRHAAQWLEVHLAGYGWLPLLDVPPMAEASLEDLSEENQVTASEDVSVDVLVPVEVRDPRLLFELVRARILQALPTIALLLLVYLTAPWAARAIRTRRRVEWAQLHGPRARIGVAYTELRDVATDLGVGDAFATPIEFLGRVQPDDEHRQLAWLVSRAMYGDLATRVTDEDALAAEEMARSLRQRMLRAQPLQTRFVALIARASLITPYSTEPPNVPLPTPVRSTRRWLRRRFAALRIRIPIRLPRLRGVARRTS